jgi:hypothetical protein
MIKPCVNHELGERYSTSVPCLVLQLPLSQ